MKSVRIGQHRCTIVEHGPVGPYPAEVLAANVPAQEAASIVGGSQVMSGLNGLLVTGPAGVVVIDTGLGPALPDRAGALSAALAANDLTPRDVTVVLASHGHPDHIGGHSTPAGPAFPNARYLIAEADREMVPNAGDGAMECFDREEIAPGIRLIEAPGHTPGHVSFLIGDDGEALLYAADALLFPGNVERPDIVSRFDMDPESAVVSRLEILEVAASAGVRTTAYHFVYPGLGAVSHTPAGYRWMPDR